MLDAGPLGKLAHRNPRTADLARLNTLLDARIPVLVPEIVDYEIRRSLLLHNLIPSLRELDLLIETLIYVPLTTAAMHRAAQLWAAARRSGRPTADSKSLDCDVILAAQALEQGARVVTDNVTHLSRLAPVVRWSEL
jgi:predicted nucleic acid-binding protein